MQVKYFQRMTYAESVFKNHVKIIPFQAGLGMMDLARVSLAEKLVQERSKRDFSFFYFFRERRGTCSKSRGMKMNAQRMTKTTNECPACLAFANEN